MRETAMRGNRRNLDQLDVFFSFSFPSKVARKNFFIFQREKGSV